MSIPLPIPGTNHDGSSGDCIQIKHDLQNLESSLTFWQNKLKSTPGPSGPGTVRDQIQQTINLLIQEIEATQATFNASDCLVPLTPPLHHVVNILIVMDGKFDPTHPTFGHSASFGPGDMVRTDSPSADAYFGLSEVIKVLTMSTISMPIKFSVIKAHRDKDPAGYADFNNFKFDEADLSFYDEIWLFGVGGPGETEDLSETELAAISRFMAKGGGIFATGDHEDLGAPLCGRIPRVRSMRKWYMEGDKNKPAAAPEAPLAVGPTRIDTTRPGHDGNLSVVPFDNQSDDIPQTIFPKFYAGSIPHPILSTSHGTITVLPDHMHEGEIITPWSLSETLTFDSQSFIEYPAKDGLQTVPEIIAQALVLPHTTPSYEQAHVGDPDSITTEHMFGAIGAYDGHTVGVGRVVTDSTWHHFFNINLIGDPIAKDSKKQGGFLVSSKGKKALNDIEDYFRNIALWLIPTKTQDRLFASLLWQLRITHPLSEVLRPNRVFNDDEMLQIGRLASQALSRTLPTWVPLLFILNYLQDSPLGDAIPPHPWSQQNAPQAGNSINFAKLTEAVLGGALVEIVKQAGDTSSNSPQDINEQIRISVAQGISYGLGVLAVRLEQEGSSLTRLATGISQALQNNLQPQFNK